MASKAEKLAAESALEQALNKRVRMRPTTAESSLQTKEQRRNAAQEVKDALFLTGRERKCLAKSARTGNPCNKWAIRGGTVCQTHGGGAPQVKAAAKRRLLEIVDPAISRLHELMLQDEHKPTALGAAVTVLNRALGKEGDGESHSRQPIINIGFAIARPGEDKPKVTVPKGLLQAEAEVIDGDTEDV